MLKKWILAACCSVLLCGVITGAVVPRLRSTLAAAPAPVSPASAAPQPQESVSRILPVPAAESVPRAKYLLKAYRGSAAVFLAGASEPIQVLELPLSVLPEADRRLLEEGIPVETEAELSALLEDYS